MHPAMNELSQLPVAERLELVQELWDSIADSKGQFPVHEWQRELARERLADFDGREEESGISRDQVWDEVDKRRDA